MEAAIKTQVGSIEEAKQSHFTPFFAKYSVSCPPPRLDSNKCKETFSFVLFVMFRVSLVPGLSFFPSGLKFARRCFAFGGILQARNPFERRGLPVPYVMSCHRDDPGERSK